MRNAVLWAAWGVVLALIGLTLHDLTGMNWIAAMAVAFVGLSALTRLLAWAFRSMRQQH